MERSDDRKGKRTRLRILAYRFEGVQRLVHVMGGIPCLGRTAAADPYGATPVPSTADRFSGLLPPRAGTEPT